MNSFLIQEKASLKIIPANFWIRLSAFLIDYNIISIILFSCKPLIKIIRAWFFTTEQEGVFNNLIGLIIQSNSFGAFFLFSLYYTWFESSKLMATPGKFFLGIAVINKNNSKISFLKALSRNISKLISSFIFFFGFLLILFRSDKRSLHDDICNTRVIYRKGKRSDFINILKFAIPSLLIIFLITKFLAPEENKSSSDPRIELLNQDINNINVYRKLILVTWLF